MPWSPASLVPTHRWRCTHRTGRHWQRPELAAGLRVVSEGFLDRAYEDDGALTPREVPGAVLHDPEVACARATAWAESGFVRTRTGRLLALPLETLCVHGDTPDAVAIATRVQSGARRRGRPPRSRHCSHEPGSADDDAARRAGRVRGVGVDVRVRLRARYAADAGVCRLHAGRACGGGDRRRALPEQPLQVRAGRAACALADRLAVRRAGIARVPAGCLVARSARRPAAAPDVGTRQPSDCT